MENERLQEDLLKEYKAEKEMIINQIDLLEPLAVSLRKPIVARVLNSVYLLVLEGLCWIAIVSVVAFCILRDKVYPFYILARIRSKSAELGFSNHDINALYASVFVFAGIIIFLLFVIYRNLAKIRKKNAVLQSASKNIKIVIGEHLNRRAAIHAIDQRHFDIIEPLPISETKINANDIPNPGI